MNGVKRYLKNTGPGSGDTKTSMKAEPITSRQLTLFAAGSHASPFLMPGSEGERKMTAISGRKLFELLTNSGPLGLLGKMLLDSQVWGSKWGTLRWKAIRLHECQRVIYIRRYSRETKSCFFSESSKTLKKSGMGR